MNYPRDPSLVKQESEFTQDEINLAKKLVIFWKEERERQGIPYTTYADMSDDLKACYLNMARQLIIVEGFDISPVGK